MYDLKYMLRICYVKVYFSTTIYHMLNGDLYFKINISYQYMSCD